MFVDFIKGGGLVPVIIQDCRNRDVLMLGYMNEEALAKTQEEKRVWFYSRSKQRLWLKGETSGNFLMLKSLAIDCDGDTLLIKVEPTGNVCHLDRRSCFYA